MFYKIDSSDKYIELSSFIYGFGFYLVDYKGFSGMSNDIHFFNTKTNLWFTLGIETEMQKEFLDKFDETEEKPEKETNKSGFVSEEFALKAMALAKANTQTIKISDIIN